MPSRLFFLNVYYSCGSRLRTIDNVAVSTLRLARRCVRSSTTSASTNIITVNGRQYEKDDWTNASPTILSYVNKRLHLQPHHPISLTRQLIESTFPGYKYHNSFPPVVTTAQNFDSLGSPEDHPARSRTDTYYLNERTLLRTHTSAHQVDVFRLNDSEGWLISADVYRRDAVDRTHYPVFHQMEGARVWDREKHGGNVSKAVWADLKTLYRPNIVVEDPNPTVHPQRNPLQDGHTLEEVEAISAHLKRSLENVVVTVVSRAKEAVGQVDLLQEEPLRVRWVEAYFPFTSPSWELEIFWQGDWLEVLGCGVVKQEVLINAGVPTQIGWAFGMGLERIAMLLFGIPDIRLFWSLDQRFLSQFTDNKPIQKFVAFSKYPPCYKDVSFWTRSTTSSARNEPCTDVQEFHENNFMEIVRIVAGDLVEDVRMVDEFTHPRSGKRSMCYRINYRSLERTLKNEEINVLQAKICDSLVAELGIELR